MEVQRPTLTFSQTPTSERSRGQQGFALVSLLALVPLLATLVLCVGVALLVIKKKALAEAYCVRAGFRVQVNLRASLDRLLRMNKAATRLRIRRALAERNLAKAVASANPYAIASAKAVLAAVVLEQTAWRLKQEAVLKEAEVHRQRAGREIASDTRALKVRGVDSRGFYTRALAVEAVPAGSLTPDFVPVPEFKFWQRHRFQFTVDLTPGLALDAALPMADKNVLSALKQTTTCAVTLAGKENAWTVQILADKPALSWW